MAATGSSKCHVRGATYPGASGHIAASDVRVDALTSAGLTLRVTGINGAEYVDIWLRRINVEGDGNYLPSDQACAKLGK